MRPGESRSEFEGGGVLDNTIFPKGADALTASDKLRLQSITGQEADPLAPPDPYHWYGNQAPELPDDGPRRAREERLRDRNRYPNR